MISKLKQAKISLRT